jgi:catechol 2,3-dioxygenase-like lactoylglutathione lyase family enzyme
MEAGGTFPRIAQVVLDCKDLRALAEFYRQLLDMRYRKGDEPESGGPEAGGEEKDWLVLRSETGGTGMAFQRVDELHESTWPDDTIPQQLHLDMIVPSAEDLEAQHDRVLSLGGRLLYDRFDDPDEQLRVYADPTGHPFCIIVVPS